MAPLSRRQREIYDRHGIRLVFTVTGTVGHYDTQTLLMQLVTSMGLFAGAVTIVDQSAQRWLKERNLFKKYKYEETPIFSEAEISESLLHPDVGAETLPERIDPGGPMSLNS